MPLGLYLCQNGDGSSHLWKLWRGAGRLSCGSQQPDRLLHHVKPREGVCLLCRRTPRKAASRSARPVGFRDRRYWANGTSSSSSSPFRGAPRLGGCTPVCWLAERRPEAPLVQGMLEARRPLESKVGGHALRCEQGRAFLYGVFTRTSGHRVLPAAVQHAPGRSGAMVLLASAEVGGGPRLGRQRRSLAPGRPAGTSPQSPGVGDHGESLGGSPALGVDP